VNRWIWISLAGILILFVVLRFVVWTSREDGLRLGPKVGVVRLEGPIFSSEKIVRQLNQFAERDDVKAVVLRINSPGGAVAPSQEIYERVKRLNSVKPVVASFGGVAASGGYYAALGSARIVANRGTITGSIGVILDYPVATDLLDKIGLRFETVKSGAFKDAGSPTREVTEEDRRYFREIVQDLHRQFVEAVVASRQMEAAQVEPLADGRVFTGEQALELGLIDTLGTFEDAIQIAGELGAIEGKPNTVELPPRRRGLWDYLFGTVQQVTSRWVPEGPAYRWRWE
jgi:protease-4